jgi:DnaD/phage-associated family protein
MSRTRDSGLRTQDSAPPFDGFPSISKATAIPNAFFALVLPRLESPEALLAFLWMARVVQQRRGDGRFATADDVWATPGARESFENLGGGRTGLEAGLDACRNVGALIALRVTGRDVRETVFLVNDPPSRRLAARARAGEVRLRPGTAIVAEASPEQRPGIFRLYEEHIGTITPIVGEQLIAAEDEYPAEWIEEAFREAAELNARSWRYVERILQRWSEEGRGHETPGRDSPEDRRQRFLGGNFGHLIKYE